MPPERNIGKRVEIERLRHDIDEIDDKLLNLIAQRRDVAMSIARLKTELQDSVDHEGRVKVILELIEKKANSKGLQGKEVRELWKAIIKYMILEQTEEYPYF